MTEGIIGCLHQEGIDYEGEWCPLCEFGRGRDRFSPKDFEVAFARMAEERTDALFVLDDALTIQSRKEIADFAMQKRLPSVFAAKDRVEAGG
jgi:hypothetical protein